MTDMTGRCRRLHQRQCEGPTTKGLCAKHRAQWEAMVEDWANRHEATLKPRSTRPDPNRPWSKAEDNTLRTRTSAMARKLLNRGKTAITTRRRELGITRDVWDDAKDQVLRENSNADACRILNKSVGAVTSRRGVARIPVYVSDPRPWTPDEDAALWHTSIARAEASMVGRSRVDIVRRRAELGIDRARKYQTTTTQKETA